MNVQTGDLASPRVIVTGAAQGIGREVACQFAEAGARLALGDIDPVAETVAAEIGAEVAVICDLSRDNDATQFVARSAMALGGLDCLMNVAGIQVVGEVGAPARRTGTDWWR